MPKPLPDDVRQAIDAGQKIDAIRLLRQHTGLGLAQAKAAVEAGLMPDDSSLATHFEAMPAEVAVALASGNKLEAIKLLRAAKGIGLKEAKEIVDRASRNQQAVGLSSGEVPRNSVSPAVVVFLIALVVVAIWFFTTAG